MYDRCSSACIESGRFIKLRSSVEVRFSNPPVDSQPSVYLRIFPCLAVGPWSAVCGLFELQSGQPNYTGAYRNTWVAMSVTTKFIPGSEHRGLYDCLLCARIASDLNIAAPIHTSSCASYLSYFIPSIMPWLKLQRSGCCRRLHYWPGRQLCYPSVRRTILGSYGGQHVLKRTLFY